jgi:hypothetical protein
MPATTFKTPLNNVSTTVGATRGVGVASLTVATGTGGKFGSPSPSAPIRVTVIQAAGISGGIITDPTKLTIFSCTGRSGDVLSGLTVIEGTTDLAFANGDTIIMAPTAEAFGDIHGAINALENATTQASVAANQIYAGPTTGAAAAPTFRAGVPADVPNLDAAKITTGTLVVARGGTGQSAYTDGQLLIGNTATGGLSKATLTPGTNVTITNANGAITIAASGGGGVPGGANTQVQYNNAGAFAGSAALTWTNSTQIFSIGDATVGPTLLINNDANHQPILKFNPASGSPAFSEGLRVFSGTTEIARFSDGAILKVSKFQSFGGFTFQDYNLQRGNSQKIDIGSALSSNVGFHFSDPSAAVGYTYQVMAVASLIAQVVLAVRGMSGQTGNLQQWESNTGTMLSGIDASGRFILATTTVDPTGTAPAGTAVYNTANSKFWVSHGGGTWKSTTLA